MERITSLLDELLEMQKIRSKRLKQSSNLLRKLMKRDSWDIYFMDIAQVIASRSTCLKKSVGCVIVSKDRHILSTGYNGSIKGTPHCTEVGCDIEGERCIRTIHAEANGIVQAARSGVSLLDSSIYITTSPCWLCFKMI